MRMQYLCVQRQQGFALFCFVFSFFVLLFSCFYSCVQLGKEQVCNHWGLYDPCPDTLSVDGNRRNVPQVQLQAPAELVPAPWSGTASYGKCKTGPVLLFCKRWTWVGVGSVAKPNCNQSYLRYETGNRKSSALKNLLLLFSAKYHRRKKETHAGLKRANNAKNNFVLPWLLFHYVQAGRAPEQS